MKKDCQVAAGSSTFKPEWGKPPCLPNRPRFIALARGRKQKRQHPPEIQQITGLEKESF